MSSQVCKLCFSVFGSEGTKKNCPENLDAEPPAHEWYKLEEVSDEQKLLTPEVCQKCPDAKYYPEGKRPFMKEKAGASKTCRNPECLMVKPSEVKPEVKPEAKRPRTSISRKSKVPANATEDEKVAIRDQQKEVAELRAQLMISETKLRLMLEAKKVDEDEEEEDAK